MLPNCNNSTQQIMAYNVSKMVNIFNEVLQRPTEEVTISKEDLMAKIDGTQDPVCIGALYKKHRTSIDRVLADATMVELMLVKGKRVFETMKDDSNRDYSITFEGLKLVFEQGVKSDELNPQRLTAVAAVRTRVARASQKSATSMQQSLPITGVESFDDHVAYLAVP